MKRKFIFIDNNEDDLNIVENILSLWNIKYKIEENNFYFAMGYISTYNVHVNMEPEFYFYIKDIIDKELNKERIRLEEKYQTIDYLDRCYYSDKNKCKSKTANLPELILGQGEVSDVIIVRSKSRKTKDSNDQ